MISVDARAAQQLLDRLAAVGGNVPKTMKKVARTMEQQTRQAFRDQRDPWGVAWAPHAPATIAGRQRRGGNRGANRQILLDTGAMFGSIRHVASGNSASVSVGEGLPDGRTEANQYGARNAGRSRTVLIPTRAFVPLRPGGRPDPSPQWWSIVLQPINDAFAEALR